jgi:hypothetical protein
VVNFLAPPANMDEMTPLIQSLRTYFFILTNLQYGAEPPYL